jgi:hypothetical protein
VSVLLSGRRDGTTHREVALLASLPPEIRLIGGLAVMVRVGTPHRTTVDLDAVARDLTRHHVTLSRLAVTSAIEGRYTFAGEMDLDVIDVSPDSASELAAQLGATDEPISDLELNALAHAWAHDTASPLDITAVDNESGEILAAATDRLVATTTGIIVMKASTVPLRASSRPEKRASDLYDLGRLLIAGKVIQANLTALPAILRDPIVASLTGWFIDDAGRDRTYRDVRRFDEPRLDLDAAADAVEQIVSMDAH